MVIQMNASYIKGSIKNIKSGNNSLWKEYKEDKKFPKLNQDLETDVLIIGGGLVGLLIGYRLKEHNINSVILEKDRIGCGITSLTTAFVTAQHETLYQDLVNNKGYEKAKEYLLLNNQSIEEYIDLGKRYDIDLEIVDSTLFSKNETLIRKEYQVLKELGQDCYLNNNIPFNENTTGVSFRNQLILNPMKLINCLSTHLEIYENSEVTCLGKNQALLKNNCLVRFKKVIIATHYPINNKLNLLFVKLTQRISYVVVIKKDKIKGTFCSLSDDGFYFRMYKDYLLVGGNDRDTGCLCKNDFEEEVVKKIKIKKEDILYSWFGQDCITCDGVPYIGYSDVFHRNHYIVTGFNLWGFTWAMASANIITRMVQDGEGVKLTKINRFVLNKNLFINIKKAIVNLLKFNKPRCRHLGCALVYNKNEHIWECPCHGSLYNEDLKVIKGPAKKNIKNTNTY